MKRIWLTLFLYPLFATAQTGVHFETGLTWQQIRSKAQAEKKSIFIDCFATWCGPCKLMDREVYPVDSVGSFINANFIAVKVQCDTSKSDSTTAKKWYTDAHQIVTEYKVSAYPTLLFLSPDGKLVHKGVGFQRPKDLVDLSKEALDPKKQYFTLLRSYQEGKKDYPAMAYLASIARKIDDKEQNPRIALDYIHNYLDKLSDEKLFTADNVEFVAGFPAVLDSKNRIFKRCLHEPAIVDSLVHNQGFSSALVNFVINKEEIIPELTTAQKNNTQPDWDALQNTISKKFGTAHTEELLIDARLNWYKSTKNWKYYTKFLVIKVEKDALDQTPSANLLNINELNESAWIIFQHSESREELEKALKWSNIVVSNTESNAGLIYGTYMDTKANLLYKLGKKNEALALEAKAAVLASKNPQVQDCFQKMKEGKPTW